MTDIKPITYSITYNVDDIEEYIEECEAQGIFPTQDGFNKHAANMFSCMLEEYARVSCFDRTVTAD